MTTVKFKVESGMQLLARLRRRPNIESFYSPLFESGPKQGEIIELYSESPTSFLLIDIITEALIPAKLGGVDAGVLIFSTDGNIDYEILTKCLQRKLVSRVANSSYEQNELTDEELQNLLHDCLSNLHILEIYDSTQFHTTFQNLDSILVDNSNISLLVLHTLTAFYWSEQGFKITKMDVYLKKILLSIKKITKEYKLTILYTRPEYFSSSKNPTEKQEGSSKQTTLENINYRVQILAKSGGSYQVNVKTSNKSYKRAYIICHNEIKWL